MWSFPKPSEVFGNSARFTVSTVAFLIFTGLGSVELRAQTTYEWASLTPGLWNLSDPNWTSGGSPVLWQNGPNSQALFNTAGVSVTLNVPITAHQVTFATSGYELTGTGPLTLAGADAGIEVAAGMSALVTVEIAGTDGLIKTGGGTLQLAEPNSYTGGTHLVSGTLLVGNDEALSSGIVTIESGTTFGTMAASVFIDPDVDFVINGDVSIQIDSFLQLLGTVNLGSATRTFTFTENGSEICFMGDILGGGGLNLQAATGTAVSVMMCGPDSNGYTGLTTVGNGVTLILEKDTNITAIAGDLQIDAGGMVSLTAWSDLVNQINSASTVTVNGVLGIESLDLFPDPTTVVIGNLQGTASGVIVNSALEAVLEVNAGDFAGVILETTDPLTLLKSGPGTLTLRGPNAYTGGTQINGGVLRTTNANALGMGPTAIVALNNGSLDIGSSGLTITTLNWSGGTIARTLSAGSSELTVTGNLSLFGTGLFAFTAGSGFSSNQEYLLLSAANLDAFLATRFSGNSLLGLRPQFILDEIALTLSVIFLGTPVFSGPLLQNSSPVGIPSWADFLVDGSVRTGGPAESNTINRLIFTPNSRLTVFNNLTVTRGDFTVDNGAATLTGGNVIVPGTFTKWGAGSLNVFSRVQVNGAANVNSGSLLVNGVFVANGGLTISPNGLLGGSGSIFGNVFNNGTLSPGNSPGTLTINGNLSLAPISTTQLEIESLSVFDRIVVSGLATLGGTLEVIPFGGNELEYGQQFNFLSAGEVAGEFDAVEMPENFRGRIVVEGGEVTLIAAPSSYTLVAKNQNQFNVAAALDGFIPATSGDRLTVSTALDELSEAQYPAAFDQISPAFYQSLTSTTIEQYNAQGQFLQQRFSSVALGRQAGFAQYGTQAPVLSEKAGKAVASAKDIVEATPDNHWGIWTLGNGIFAKSSIASIPNYRSDSGGFLVGGDYRWSETFVTGVFGGYQGTASRYANGGRTTINAARFGAYATYDSGNGFYANTVVGGGYSAYDVKRPIQFGNLNRAASSAPGGAEFTSQLAAGYDWKVGGFTFGPVANVQYTYAGVGGFGENGADSLDLRVGQQNANSLRTTLGARAAYTWVVSDQIAIIPEVRMSWQHEFLMNPTGMSAALDGGSGPGFGYTSTAPARDAVFAGAGVTLQVGDRWNASFYYNADFGRSDFTSQMISGGLGISF